MFLFNIMKLACRKVNLYIQQFKFHYNLCYFIKGMCVHMHT